MNQKLQNLITLTFLATFSFGISEVISAEKESTKTPSHLHVKSHLKFDKKFSGNTFVLDGDSLKVGGKEVRLFGIDAPEYKQTCFTAKKEEYECGQKSLSFLINLAGGKQVECVYAEKDKYNRFLSKCFVGEGSKRVSINEEIVKNGHGVIYNFTESDPKMNELETEAKEKKLGIWQGAFQLPKDYRKQHPRN